MNKDLEIIKVQIKENIATLITQKRLEEATMLIKQYQKMVTDDFEVFSMQAIIAMEEGNFTEAEDLLYDGLFINNNSFDLSYNLAYLFEIQEKYPKARAIYSNLLQDECDRGQRLLLQESVNRLDKIATINDATKVPLQHKKILHGTMEIANQMRALTSGLQKNGYQASSVNYYPTYLGYQADINIFNDCKTQEDAERRITKFAKQASMEYNIFHFYFGTSLTLDHSDLPLLKSFGKKMLMNYLGSDVRRLSIAQKYNPYAIAKNSDESKIINDMEKIAKSITHCAVGDQELYLYVKDYFPNVHILPAAIDIASYCPQLTKVNPKPLFVHAPTSPEVKGTKYILHAIEILQQEYDFDFQLIQGMSHDQAKLAYQQADLIIDQILFGSHGLLAIEAMAMGKPVVCWISDYMQDKYFEDLPIIIANPDTITDVLRYVLCNMDMLPELGKRGRRYVEQNHDANHVAEKLISIYQGL